MARAAELLQQSPALLRDEQAPQRGALHHPQLEALLASAPGLSNVLEAQALSQRLAELGSPLATLGLLRGESSLGGREIEALARLARRRQLPTLLWSGLRSATPGWSSAAG